MSDSENGNCDYAPFDDFIRDPDEPEWDAEELEEFLKNPDLYLVRSEVR
jgi:cytochrome c2